MALKFKITKAEFDKLSDELKGEYTLVGDAATLDVDGGPDPKGGEKFSAERDRRRAAEKRAKDAEEALVALEEKTEDVKALESKHAKEVKKLTDERDGATKKYTEYAEKALKEGVATDIAGKLTKSPAVLKPHILARVTVDMTGDEPKTVFLNKDGKPDDKLTADDVAKDFRDNKDFAAIIVGTHASGGVSSRQSPNGNGNPGLPQQQRQQPGERPMYSAMSPRDLAASLAQSTTARTGGNPS